MHLGDEKLLQAWQTSKQLVLEACAGNRTILGGMWRHVRWSPVVRMGLNLNRARIALLPIYAQESWEFSGARVASKLREGPSRHENATGRGEWFSSS